MPVPLSPWTLLALALPVLLLGEILVTRFTWLARLNLPASVVGGLLCGFGLFAARAFDHPVAITTQVTAPGWTWLVAPGWGWPRTAAIEVNTPLLIGFFTCVGLGIPVKLLRTGGRTLLLLLLLSGALAVVQNLGGVAVAKLLGVPPRLGVLCGSLTLVGGHGTALGFASRFEQAGLHSAATLGAAAATVGLVAGGLLAGPLAEWLLRDRSGAGRQEPLAQGAMIRRGFLSTVASLARAGAPAFLHGLLVLGCMKSGAWLSFYLDRLGVTLPAYMGALLVGLAVRVGHDGAGGAWLRPGLVADLGGVLLPLFLTITLMALNVADLARVAGPMAIILGVNIVLTLAFLRLVAWPALGQDYEAGVMVAGLAGFGLGSTATAVAAMETIAARRGPAPRAFSFVPPTGGFLIDLINAPIITGFIKIL